MNRAEYKPRIIDATVEKYLRTFGAVCLEGPKWCGKTWTSAEHANSEFYVGVADRHIGHAVARSEEGRVGKECRVGCRSRWGPYH